MSISACLPCNPDGLPWDHNELLRVRGHRISGECYSYGMLGLTVTPHDRHVDSKPGLSYKCSSGKASGFPETLSTVI